MAGLRQPPANVRCALHCFESFNERVARIQLKPVLGALPRIRPGQYLIARLLNGHEVPLSIANVPSMNDNLIELHIDYAAGRRATRAVIDQLTSERAIDVALPHGNVWVDQAADSPLVLLASGTGFAQSRAILEGLLRNGSKAKVRLFWRMLNPSGFYQTELLERWAERYRGFDFELMCSASEAEERFHQQVARELESLDCRRLIISGSKRFAESCWAWHASEENVAMVIESDMLRRQPRAGEDRLQARVGHG